MSRIICAHDREGSSMRPLARLFPVIMKVALVLYLARIERTDLV